MAESLFFVRIDDLEVGLNDIFVAFPVLLFGHLGGGGLVHLGRDTVHLLLEFTNFGLNSSLVEVLDIYGSLAVLLGYQRPQFGSKGLHGRF